MDPEGARLLTYSTIMPTVSPACRLSTTLHRASCCSLQQAAAIDAVLHALRP